MLSSSNVIVFETSSIKLLNLFTCSLTLFLQPTNKNIDKNNNIDLIKILDKTKYGSDGIGGIITKGTMYIGYPR